MVVLGHLAHKHCLQRLQDEGLIIPFSERNASLPSDIDLSASDTRDAAFRGDLFCFGPAEHPSLEINPKVFENKSLLLQLGETVLSSSRTRGHWADLAESSTKTIIPMSDYFKYQSAFCEKYTKRKAMYRSVFGIPLQRADDTGVKDSRDSLAAFLAREIPHICGMLLRTQKISRRDQIFSESLFCSRAQILLPS